MHVNLENEGLFFSSSSKSGAHAKDTNTFQTNNLPAYCLFYCSRMHSFEHDYSSTFLVLHHPILLYLGKPMHENQQVKKKLVQRFITSRLNKKIAGKHLPI